jgi:hypothetical protein
MIRIFDAAPEEAERGQDSGNEPDPESTEDASPSETSESKASPSVAKRSKNAKSAEVGPAPSEANVSGDASKTGDEE